MKNIEKRKIENEYNFKQSNKKQKQKYDITCNICNICYTIIDDIPYRCQIKCNSFYHKECAEKWSQKCNSCPNCRSIDFIKDTDNNCIFSSIIFLSHEERQQIARAPRELVVER